MDTLHKLTDLFRQFPGIGPRQAKRFVYFLLSKEPEFIDSLASLSSTLNKEIVQCKDCFRFFQKWSGGIAIRSLCADPNRVPSELMVVAKDTDLESVEKSGVYHGHYFVLGGTIPLIPRKITEKVRLQELTARVAKETKNGTLKEIILALSANPDGEHTSIELKTLLAPYGVTITALGRGLSTGSELEYADPATLTSAFKNRSVQNI